MDNELKVGQSPDGHRVEISCGTTSIVLVASKKQRGQWNCWPNSFPAKNLDNMVRVLTAARDLLPKMRIGMMEIGQLCYEQPG